MRRSSVFVIALVIALCSCSWAANYYVKTTGSNSNNGTDPSTPFLTITFAAGKAVAGDTVTVYAGNYAEYVPLSHSGTGSFFSCVACITFQVNTGDTVQVYGFNVTGNYNIINGFKITDTSFSHTTAGAGVQVHQGTTGNQIINNTLIGVGFANSLQLSAGYPCIQLAQSGTTGSNYVTITGNTISWCSADPAQVQLTNPATSGACPTPGTVPNACNPHIANGMSVAGSHILIANNTISHVNNAIYVGAGSTYVVMRGNAFDGTYIGHIDTTTLSGPPPQWDAYNCLESNNCDNHVDFIGLFGGTNTNILMENNTERNIWGTQGAHGIFTSATAATNTQWISRFSKYYQVGSGYLSNANATTAHYGVSYWKDYNNSYIQSQQQSATAPNAGFAGCGTTTLNANNGSFFNNLFYNDANPAGTPTGYYGWVGTSCLTSFTHGNNLAFDSSAVSSGLCTSNDLSHCTTGQMASGTGNVWGDPKLVATDGTNFQLSIGSPAINTGRPTTTVASNSTGTTITLTDAGVFQDGWLGTDSSSVALVPPDTIRIGASTVVQILPGTINLATNQVSVSSSVTVSAGDVVSLYKLTDNTSVLSGSAPNIGAGPNAESPSILTIHCAGPGSSAASGFDAVDGGGTHTTATCAAGVATCVSGSASGTDGCFNNYANNTNVTITGTAGVGSVLGSLSGGGCSTSPCVVNTGTANLDVYGTFSITPTVSLSSDHTGCNVLQGCSLVLTFTGANLDVVNGGWTVSDANGVLTDTSTGFPTSCTYGIANALCGDGTHPSGTFTLHVTLTAAQMANVEQWTATATASAGAVPATPASVTVRLAGSTAGTILGTVNH